MFAEISSSSFEPVFDIEKCDIPAIPPIEDLDFVDCVIPPEITPITDCADIDLPINLRHVHTIITSISGIAGPKGPKGDPGADGSPGEDGEDGCNPTITVARSVTCVYSKEEVNVTVSISEVSPCTWQITFNFFLYCADFNPEQGCCFWVWCPCADAESIGPDEAAECGFVLEYCTNAPGQWTLLSNMSAAQCAEREPPCIKGWFHGQVEVNCSCLDRCYELTNCDYSFDKIYASNEEFASATVGTVYRRTSAQGGGCYYLSDKNANCSELTPIEFAYTNSYSTCGLCPGPDDCDCVVCLDNDGFEAAACDQCARFTYTTTTGAEASYKVATYIGSKAWAASTIICGKEVSAKLYCADEGGNPNLVRMEIRVGGNVFIDAAASYDVFTGIYSLSATGAGCPSDLKEDLPCLEENEVGGICEPIASIEVAFNLLFQPCAEDDFGNKIPCDGCFSPPPGGCGANPGIGW